MANPVSYTCVKCGVEVPPGPFDPKLVEDQIYDLATISPLHKWEIISLLNRVKARVIAIPSKRATPV
jgi:hypothetical protein